MPRCDWLQHCNFLAGIEILPIALQTAWKPCGFAVGRPAIVAGPVLWVAIGESCSVCRALYTHFSEPTTQCNINVNWLSDLWMLSSQTSYTYWNVANTDQLRQYDTYQSRYWWKATSCSGWIISRWKVKDTDQLTLCWAHHGRLFTSCRAGLVWLRTSRKHTGLFALLL